MEGGKLEIIHHNKHEGLERVASGQNYESGIVGYEQPGKMILAQGSEILHHVTPVTNSATRYDKSVKSNSRLNSDLVRSANVSGDGIFFAGYL